MWTKPSSAFVRSICTRFVLPKVVATSCFISQKTLKLKRSHPGMSLSALELWWMCYDRMIGERGFLLRRNLSTSISCDVSCRRKCGLAAQSKHNNRTLRGWAERWEPQGRQFHIQMWALTWDVVTMDNLAQDWQFVIVVTRTAKQSRPEEARLRNFQFQG